MRKALSTLLVALISLIPAISIHATATPTVTPSPTPQACTLFQTGCGTAVPLYTAVPTVSIPTPTFIPAGLPPPPFPQIYDPATEPHNASPIGLTLTSAHITLLTWDMMTYGVQMWNYYYNVMDNGAHAAIDAAEGALLVIMVITLMLNLFADFKPKINATINDTRDRANRWAAGGEAPSGSSSSTTTPPGGTTP